MTDQDFVELVQAVRQGDSDAMNRFCSHYRLLAVAAANQRIRLGGAPPTIDASDVGQSVLLKVVQGIQTGQMTFDLEQKLRALIRLLVWHKLVELMRRKQVRLAAVAANDDEFQLLNSLPDEHAPTPSQVNIAQEILEHVQGRLEPRLQRVLELRLEGHDWREISTQVKERTHTVRVRFNRAVKRALAEYNQSRPPDDSNS